MVSAIDCEDQVTDELSMGQQGPVLCPVCEQGYALTMKGVNKVGAGVVLDCYYEKCITGCGSVFGNEKSTNENARIARSKGVGSRDSVLRGSGL